MGRKILFVSVITFLIGLTVVDRGINFKRGNKMITKKELQNQVKELQNRVGLLEEGLGSLKENLGDRRVINKQISSFGLSTLERDFYAIYLPDLEAEVKAVEKYLGIEKHIVPAKPERMEMKKVAEKEGE